MSLEFDEQLSYLRKPKKSEMTKAEYGIFNKLAKAMQEKWGFINNLLKILPLNAKQYIGFLDFKDSLFNENCYLTNAQKEMIGVVVSSCNCCTYCLSTHCDALRGLWGDSALVDKLSYNYRSCRAELSEQDFALCEYAWFVTAKPSEIDNTQVEKLRAVGLSDNQILEAAFSAGFFNYTNRWASTIGAIPNKGHFNHNR